MFKVGDKVCCRFRLPYPLQWWVQPTVYVATILEPDTDPAKWNGSNSEASYCLATGKLKLEYSWGGNKVIMYDPIEDLFPAPRDTDYQIGSEEEAASLLKIADASAKSGSPDRYKCIFSGEDGKPDGVTEWGQYKSGWFPMYRNDDGVYIVGPISPESARKNDIPYHVDNNTARELLGIHYEHARQYGGMWNAYPAGWIQWKDGVWIVRRKHQISHLSRGE